jgi:NADPH:quinone reductase-like Zn-dependent oxidoreductase
MRGTILYGAGDVRFEDRPDPVISEPTDASSVVATCVCGSDLWPYRGVDQLPASPYGHEYVGIVEEIGDGVATLRPGSSWSAASALMAPARTVAGFPFLLRAFHRLRRLPSEFIRIRRPTAPFATPQSAG